MQLFMIQAIIMCHNIEQTLAERCKLQTWQNAILRNYANEVISMQQLTPKSNQVQRVVIGVIIRG